MPTGTVIISGEALALFSALLSAVCGVVLYLFFLAWRERDRSAREVKEQYDARASDLKAENLRLVSVAAASDRDAIVILGMIRDNVVSGGHTMTALQRTIETIAQTMTSLQRTVEAQQQTMASMQQTMASMQRIVEAREPRGR
jgi:uncharacterized coiled-coil protein SlyX